MIQQVVGISRFFYKCMICITLAFLILFPCCDPPHYHSGAGYNTNPALDLFGARLDTSGSSYIIKSYFRSSITGRTEYIYENLNLQFPADLTVKKKYSLPDKSISAWYAKGGQAGQIETKKAAGSITVLSRSGDEIKLSIELTFSGFIRKGALLKIPDTVKRSGTITAVKGYKLY